MNKIVFIIIVKIICSNILLMLSRVAYHNECTLYFRIVFLLYCTNFIQFLLFLLGFFSLHSCTFSLTFLNWIGINMRYVKYINPVQVLLIHLSCSPPLILHLSLSLINALLLSLLIPLMEHLNSFWC